ncbi:IS21-like element helper ATPase IstB [Pseudolysobacter antarcticus]|nr:IS21-like element helper ATPase IstB [Pseudolysobacter antarcticus]
MPTHDLVKTLHDLKMPAMAASLLSQFDDPASEERTFEDRLASLLKAECLRRADERAERFLRLAKCPAMADLALWQANGRTGLKRSMIDSLASCAWVDRTHNLLITGPSGIGKTFLACALGREAAKKNRSLAYWRLPALLDALHTAKEAGRLIDMRARLERTRLLILDDWLVDCPSQEDVQELRRVIETREGKASTLVASQYPIDAWHRRLGDPTLADGILDRLTSVAHRIALAGASMRRRAPDPMALDQGVVTLSEQPAEQHRRSARTGQ